MFLKALFAFLLVACVFSAYNPLLSREMIYMSSAAYYSTDSIDAWSCPECKQYRATQTKSFYSSKKNTQGFTAYLPDHNAILIAFRGSTDITNWLTNLNFLTTSYPGCSNCSAHLGFYQAYQQVSPIVLTQVNDLLSIYQFAKIYVTGHSLGGALAVLCALEVKSIFGKVDELITIGQPRVGTQNFAAFLQSQLPNYYRIINYADTAVHAPPKAFKFNHAGHQVWYNPRGMQQYDICVSEDKKCANSVSTLNFSVNDHRLENYESIKTDYSWIEWMMNGIHRNLRKEDQYPYTDQDIQIYELNNLNRIINVLKQQN